MAQMDEWQAIVRYKDHSFTFFDKKLPGIHAISQLCDHWFGWNTDYIIKPFKEYNGTDNHVFQFSRISIDGIELIEVILTLMPIKREVE